jgi:Triosephosphate isomerase
MKFSALSLLSVVASAGAFAPLAISPRPATFLDATRKPFISGNWKLNPQTRDEAITLAKDIAASITDKSPDSDVALFVPYVFIESVSTAIGDSKLSIGAEVCICAASVEPTQGKLSNLSHTCFDCRVSVPRFRVLSLVLFPPPCFSLLV